MCCAPISRRSPDPLMTAPTATQATWAADWEPLTTDPTDDDVRRLFVRLTYRDVAKMIDHSLLRPELDDAFITENIRLAVDYGVASVTMRPADVSRAVELVSGSDVLVGTVVG